MSIDHTETTDHVEGDAADAHAHGLTDLGYVKVAAMLAVMTGLEVTLTYLDLPGGVFMTALLGLMVLKFWTVVSYFMHLKFDNGRFSRMFALGSIGALTLYAVVLLMFGIWGK